MNKLVRRNRAPVVIGASLVQFTVIGGVFAYGVFFSALETELHHLPFSLWGYWQ